MERHPAAALGAQAGRDPGGAERQDQDHAAGRRARDALPAAGCTLGCLDPARRRGGSRGVLRARRGEERDEREQLFRIVGLGDEVVKAARLGARAVARCAVSGNRDQHRAL